MRYIKKIIKLHTTASLSTRDISRVVRLPKSTVTDYISRFKSSALSEEELNALNDSQIYQKLFSQPPRLRGKVRPDFAYIHNELKKKGVTRQLLWEEYREKHSEGMGYTQFCYHYGQWVKQLNVSMRQVHKGGEKLFIDYSGLKGKISDPESGEVCEVEIFVCTLGASGYTFAEAAPNQKLHTFIDSHINAFDYFEGTPQILVPDNLKSAVTKADRYDPQINETYQDMADHYGCVVIPARSYKPKDKSVVELAVKLVQRWILARIRNEVFLSIESLNQRIRELLIAYNHKKIRKLGKSRYELFIELDKPALKGLPIRHYEWKCFKYTGVNADYHIQVEGAFYSLPYQLNGKEVLARYDLRSVEILYNNKVVALHARLFEKGRYSTQPAHMPPSHQRYALLSPSVLINAAMDIGPYTGDLIRKVIEEDKHPQKGCRCAYGILRAARAHKNDQEVELASARMLQMGIKRLLHFESILRRKAWNLKEGEEILLPEVDGDCDHLRGGSYYH